MLVEESSTTPFGFGRLRISLTILADKEILQVYISIQLWKNCTNSINLPEPLNPKLSSACCSVAEDKI
jgi:hypothetical protein